MASIQCSIELYDGVTPVLDSMSAGLDSIIGKFEAFNAMGGNMGAMVDSESLAQASNAINMIAEGAGAAAIAVSQISDGFSLAAASADSLQAAFDAVQISAAGINESLFSAFDVTGIQTMIMTLDTMLLTLTQISVAGQTTATGLTDSFNLAAEEIVVTFDSASTRIMSIFASLGAYISSFASSLPSYFSGPLNTIASMFSSMAASAKASLASVVSAASSAAASVSASASSISASVARVSSMSLSGVGSVTAMSRAWSVSTLGGQMEGIEDVLFDGGVSSKDYSIINDYTGSDTQASGQTVINVEVNNENYISSEADVDAVLQEFEDRFNEAVLTSAQGVY